MGAKAKKPFKPNPEFFCREKTEEPTLLISDWNGKTVKRTVITVLSSLGGLVALGLITYFALDVRNTIKELQIDMAGVKVTTTETRTTLKFVGDRLDKIDTRLDKMDDRFDKVDAKLNSISEHVYHLDGRVSALEKHDTPK